MPTTGPDSTERLSCDYLVVGAGAAGCVVAARLSEDPTVQVLLLEAGPGRRRLMNRVPGTAFMASINARTNWNFTTEPVPALGGRRQQWSQGRIVGGSSAINGMLWMRGGSADYDHWRQLGCSGWSYADLLPFFRKAENSDRGDSPWHGGEGPLSIRRSRLDLPVGDLFLDAMRDAGFPLVDDVNADIACGFGRFDVNVRRGRRHGAAEAYLDPARRRANLRVLAEAEATRITVEQGRATGALFRGPDGAGRIEVRREIVLCGGAVKSPQLLLLSGIGPASELQALGIEVVRDSAGVGRNLHNHPSFALTYALKEPISAYRYMAPHRALACGLRYFTTGGGPLGESYVALGGIFASDPALAAPDMMVVVLPALVKRAEVGARIGEVVDRRHGLTVLVSLARQRSRGLLRLSSADPAAAPEIHPGYFADDADMQAMVTGLRRVRTAMRGPSVARRIAAELQPEDPSNEPAAVEAAIRARSGTFYHPGGTCRMGDDRESVVDSRLRVRGVAGLRVADASIAPTPINASMHAPSIMIGEKAAAMMAEDRLADRPSMAPRMAPAAQI